VRLGAKPDGLTERVALALNLAPVPIAESMFSMAVGRALQVAQRTGIFASLASAPRTPAQLAAELELQETGTRLVLDVLTMLGHVELDSEGRFSLATRARKWLDPGSEDYVGDFLGDNFHYWEWWQGLEGLVRDGKAVEIHDKEADDPYWRSYMRGQYQLARLSSAEVAKAVAPAAGAGSLLDVAGGHGEYSMALCRAHEGLRSTIVDLPGSAAIGREIVAEAGMSDRVVHRDGDMFEADLGGPHDAALCFNIVHHLDVEQATRLFRRIRETLKPGAPLCVLELYRRAPGERPDSSALLGLFFHLTSGADTYSTDEVSGWLREAGFAKPTRSEFRRLPNLELLRAEAA
jgi:SAM-dependent methyltransferase